MHYRSTSLCLSLIILTINTIVFATNAAKPQTYLFESFENEQAIKGMWIPKPGGISGGFTEEHQIVKNGKSAEKISWDFTNFQDKDMDFVQYTLARKLLGQPQKVRMWVYNPDNSPVSLMLWTLDASGEVYIASASADKKGWQELTFDFTNACPAWDSGDKNRSRDLPMTIQGITINNQAVKKGYLIIDDISVDTLAAPREMLRQLPSTKQPFNIFWQDNPVVEITVRNYATDKVDSIKTDYQITDLYTNKVVDSGELNFGDIPAGEFKTLQISLELKYGLYLITCDLKDVNGKITSDGIDVCRMMPKNYAGLSKAEQEYLMRCVPLGGVFWQCTPEKASDTGARWIRNWFNWVEVEKTKGEFDFSGSVAQLEKFYSAGIDSIWLSTLYNCPSFWHPDMPDYAHAYGSYHVKLTKALGPKTYAYELGNEDNGPSKYIYTEIGRNGAAAIRSVRADVPTATSGTAFVDIGWLQLQAKRKLMDWFDAMIVHPYTCDSSPEKWGVYEQAQNLTKVSDSVGGMKRIWSTEWGWPTHGEAFSIPDTTRVNYIPRHFLIGTAGGYEKNGLYAWDGHFGIYDNGRPLLPAVSLHAMAKILEGYRFAGILEKSPERWVVVWEKFGKPILIVWAPAEKQKYKLETGNSEFIIKDIFGNNLRGRMEDGKLSLTLDAGPKYILGLDESYTKKAWETQLDVLTKRLATLLPQTHAVNSKILNDVVTQNNNNADAIWAAAKEVATKNANMPRNQYDAIMANLLRMLTLNARIGNISSAIKADTKDFISKTIKQLEDAQQKDLNAYALRWMLVDYIDIEKEREFALSQGKTDFAAKLAAAQRAIATFADKYLAKRVNFIAAWPYLYTLENDGRLCEKIRLIPGQSRTVNVRINNYALNNYDATVKLNVPTGWTVSPKSKHISLKAGQPIETTFEITAAETANPIITAQLVIPGKPVSECIFDDFEILPSIIVSCEPLNAPLPKAPLKLTLTNVGKKSTGGTIRIFIKGDMRALARAEFQPLEHGKQTTITLQMNPDTEVPANNEWPLVAQLILDDGKLSDQQKVFNQPLDVDFLLAVEADAPLEIDGNLKEWDNAFPLHLNREEYTRGSFGKSWSPSDLSGKTMLKWDKDYLYVAAIVNDQVFNQSTVDAAIWSQDSIQLGFNVADGNPKYSTELAMALTSKGNQTWQFTPTQGPLDSVKLCVKVAPGKIVYEAAIPWSALPNARQPKIGNEFLFAVLLNDDDAIVPRRFLERFAGTISYDKDLSRGGRIKLIGVQPQTSRNSDEKKTTILIEDFEEYAPASFPDTWKRAINKIPYPKIFIQEHVGRNNSKAAVLQNMLPTEMPHHYMVACRVLEDFEANCMYELSAWVKGNIKSTSWCIGIVCDLWGNQPYAYATWTPSNEWQEIKVSFAAPAGMPAYCILRTIPGSQYGTLYVDDIKIIKK